MAGHAAGLPFPEPTAVDLRSPEPTSYDVAKYGRIIDWTSRTILIDGIPRVIVAAEFHYFRVPDVKRWRPILESLRGAGFNAVRLYIFWGYHSPNQDTLDFTGNRDLAYLLDLCVELKLFVIPAPGPYICAEVQAGGFPIWLVAKRHLRVRHLTNPPFGLVKKWDQEFHDHCEHYMREVLKILVPYERTTNPSGCIIAFQLENELREMVAGLVGGLDNELRLLADIAREMGSTVPFFHNDDNPVGSWAAGESHRNPKKGFKRTGPPAYRADLYGFDLYFTFPPGDKSGDLSSSQVGMLEAGGVSACLNGCGVGGPGIGGSDTKGLSCLYNPDIKSAPPPAVGWATANQMEPKVDTLEATFQAISGSAVSAPPFVAETQVGWINQWARLRGYDDIYNFFGNDFSATLLVSLLAQGITMSNHYMSYGGTNHGAIGDTEVYTSYDYSAFVREYGLLSERGRRLRPMTYFMRSFATRGLAHADRIDGAPTSKSKRQNNAPNARVKTTVKEALLNVRTAVLPEDATALALPDSVKTQPPMFAFLRNLFGRSGRFNLIVDDVVVPCFVPPHEAMIAPLYYPLFLAGETQKASASVDVLACTVPVVVRASYAGAELWILRTREAETGRLILRNVASDGASQGHGIQAAWATLPAADVGGEAIAGTSASTDDGLSHSGVLAASSQDAGAATSALSAPLEELPLGDGSTAGGVNGQAPLAVRASTETVGLCYTFTFSGGKAPCVASIADAKDPETPILRLLCLSDLDAGTLTADCSSDDPYDSALKNQTPVPFAAAWGAQELAFTASGALNVSYSPHKAQRVFLVREGSDKAAPRDFSVAPQTATAVLPGICMYDAPTASVEAALSSSTVGPADTSLLDPSFEIPLAGWYRRALSWQDDFAWKSISYANRDPLDHKITAGYIAYRVRFRTSSERASIVTNVRHVAGIWCNGVMVGHQIVYSHNAVSAGAMHAVDISKAGKQRHDLSRGMAAIRPEANGLHEVIILILSFGQSRSPFLLNDVRNKRGLLSARLSRRVKYTDVDWAIAGVDVTTLKNSYETTGLPLEADANDAATTAGFESVPSPAVVPDLGVVYYRTSFKVPACSVSGGDVRFPLRVKVESTRRAVIMLWVNGVQMGRFVEQCGPQSDFYVPEGAITSAKDNMLVASVHGPYAGDVRIRILPWVVDHVSGNLDETHGRVYAVRTASFALSGNKA